MLLRKNPWLSILALLGLVLVEASPAPGGPRLMMRLPGPARRPEPPRPSPPAPHPQTMAPNAMSTVRPFVTSPAAPGVGVPTPQTVFRSGLFVPSVANQSINPNFLLAPGLTLPQAAFNTAVIGRALSTIPPYALGFSPYLQSGGFGGGYPGIGYSMAGYPGYGGGGYGGGYGGMGYGLSTSGYGQDMSTMNNPYAMTTGYGADQNSSGQATSYPAVSASGTVQEAQVVKPETNSSLVSNTKPEHPEKTRDIWIYDNSFSPPMMMVPAGTTVRWINYGYHSHSVASGEGQWDSGPMQRGAEFTLTFSKPGTYRYSCRYHPQEMTATITVTK